jgi:hypothetical protein
VALNDGTILKTPDRSCGPLPRTGHSQFPRTQGSNRSMEAEATLAREFGISRETAVAAARHKRHQDRDH